MELSKVRYLLTEAFLLCFPFSVFSLDLNVGGNLCSKEEDCTSIIAGKVVCDKKHNQCYCAEGHVEVLRKLKCVPDDSIKTKAHEKFSEMSQKNSLKKYTYWFATGKCVECNRRDYIEVTGLGGVCEVSEQCRRGDSNSICSYFDAYNLNLMVCQCRAGFEEEEVDGRRKCVAARRSSFLGGSPHFDSGDTVPIAMGCLAAGLALIACCAGIVQLMRKKNGSRSFRWGDSQHPHESLALNGFTASQLCGDPYAALCITGVGPLSSTSPMIMPPPPLTAPEEDLPPSYEEAIKQMAPYMPVTLTQSDKI